MCLAKIRLRLDDDKVSMRFSNEIRSVWGSYNDWKLFKNKRKYELILVPLIFSSVLFTI